MTRTHHARWSLRSALALRALAALAALALAALTPAPPAAAQDEPADPALEPSPAQPHALRARLAAGLGVGLRELDLPSTAGPRRLRSGPFPALDVELSAAQQLAARFELGARLRYQTSLGLVGRETPYGGAPRETSLRVHGFQGGLVPALRFSSSPHAVSLGLFAGWGIRALRTESGLGIPDFSVHGPVLRLELRAPLSGERLELRLAPELAAWLGMSGALRKTGALEAPGVAFGGEAALHLSLSETFGIALAYRGARGSVGSALGGSFVDTEHCASLQLSLNP